jgi:hypothetical protein
MLSSTDIDVTALKILKVMPSMCTCLQTCAPLAWLSAVMPSNWLEEAVLLVMVLPLQSFCAMPTIMLLEACMIRRSVCSSMSHSCALRYAFADSTNGCSLVHGMLCKLVKFRANSAACTQHVWQEWQ